jgi:glycosyltransferase involved in cell wall biosynthesis
MTKLRVAIVAPSLGILGGQAVQADRLVEAWRDDPDVEAWLVPVNPEPPQLIRRAAAVKYIRTCITQCCYLPSLIRELRRADVVHIFSAAYSSFLLAPLPAIAVARAFGRPTVLNYRSGEASDHLRRSPIARNAIASVTRNIVPSRFLVDVFASFGIEATSIPNVLDLERFRFRARVPLRPRLVSTRNFAGLYNVGCTLRAFGMVQQRWPEATLTLVGTGAEAPKLRALAASLQLKHVTFAGAVAPKDIATYYGDADIYIQSPNIDNMPTSVLEAFASGLPVVSTEAGGVPAILTHGVHGLLAPLADYETLGHHVLRLLADPDHARQLARAAFTTCEACTWPRVRDQWVRAYRSVLPPHRSATTVGGDEASHSGRASGFSDASPASSGAERSR